MRFMRFVYPFILHLPCCTNRIRLMMKNRIYALTLGDNNGTRRFSDGKRGVHDERWSWWNVDLIHECLSRGQLVHILRFLFLHSFSKIINLKGINLFPTVVCRHLSVYPLPMKPRRAHFHTSSRSRASVFSFYFLISSKLATRGMERCMLQCYVYIQPLLDAWNMFDSIHFVFVCFLFSLIVRRCTYIYWDLFIHFFGFLSSDFVRRTKIFHWDRVVQY